MRGALTADRLRDALEYNQETGEFHWRRTRSGRGKNKVRAGDLAGSATDNGYVSINFCGRQYKAHRLAWLYMMGDWPSEQIDHIDTNRSNNSWRNLRAASPQQNAQNQLRPSKNNKSGRLGVSWCKEQKKWAATLHVNGRNVRLGRFADIEQASAAYWSAKAAHHPFANIDGVAG